MRSVAAQMREDARVARAVERALGAAWLTMGELTAQTATPRQRCCRAVWALGAVRVGLFARRRQGAGRRRREYRLLRPAEAVRAR